MKKSIFRSQKTQEAFEKWVGGPLGPNYHPCDDERFYSFVNIYFKENEHVEKDAFVKAAKKHHPTSRENKRGMYQEYYGKLQTITAFLKSQNVSFET